LSISGEKNAYRWRAKDSKTKLKLFGLLTKHRSYEDGTKVLFKTIKNRFDSQFIERAKQGKKIIFVSDKLGHYKKGFNKYFRYVAELRFGISIKQKKHGYKHNNNVIERDNREIKQRYYSMIGFKELNSANTILDLLDTYNNYIDQKKNKTPAQRAGINLDLGETHQFLNLIKVSKTK
jgi:transposase-like protein